MKLKDGVVMSGLQLVMRPILIEADRIWREYGQELVVTSALDGEHSAGSYHYYGLALDFRTSYFSEEVREQVFNELQSRMSWRYDVVLHDTHIHVEAPV